MNKTRLTTIAMLSASLAVPAIAGAADEPSQANQKNAAKYCKALRTASGDANFKAMFGGKKNAYGKCVSKAARADAKQEDQAKTNASQRCKAEEAQTADEFKAAHGGKTFQEFYGTGKGKNAHGKCVSQKAKANKTEADKQEKQDATDSAKECKAEQDQTADQFKAAHGGKTFAEYYGTNANHKNAFGKCVSAKSKERAEQEDEQENAPTT